MSDQGSWEPGAFDFKDLLEGVRSNAVVHANGFTRHWDETAQVPFVYNPTSGIFITYDDETSVGRKTDYAIAEGHRGVMYWSMDSDTESLHLQKAIHSRFYPTHIARTAGPDASPALMLRWYGLTGQTYTVQSNTGLVLGSWTACSTLADTSGAPFTGEPGANRFVTVLDTNIEPDSFRTYRIRHANP